MRGSGIKGITCEYTCVRADVVLLPVIKPRRANNQRIIADTLLKQV
jgi:hypothetical protein